MIRDAEAGDKTALVELIKHSHEAAGFETGEASHGFCVPFERGFAERLFDYHLNTPGCLCALYERSTGPQGFLMATAFQHAFGNVLMAKETAFWIEPDSRGGTAAVRLLERYDEWAKSLGCSYVGMAGMGSDPQVAKLYERRGYRVAEVHYLKSI